MNRNLNKSMYFHSEHFKMKMINFGKPSPTISTSKPSNESNDDEVEKISSTIFGCFSINARTIFYRRVYLLQMICFPFIPILALFVQNFSIFLQQLNTYDQSTLINEEVTTKVSNELRLSQKENYCEYFF